MIMRTICFVLGWVSAVTCLFFATANPALSVACAAFSAIMFLQYAYLRFEYATIMNWRDLKDNHEKLHKGSKKAFTKVADMHKNLEHQVKELQDELSKLQKERSAPQTDA